MSVGWDEVSGSAAGAVSSWSRMPLTKAITRQKTWRHRSEHGEIVETKEKVWGNKVDGARSMEAGIKWWEIKVGLMKGGWRAGEEKGWQTEEWDEKHRKWEVEMSRSLQTPPAPRGKARSPARGKTYVSKLNYNVQDRIHQINRPLVCDFHVCAVQVTHLWLRDK